MRRSWQWVVDVEVGFDRIIVADFTLGPIFSVGVIRDDVRDPASPADLEIGDSF